MTTALVLPHPEREAPEIGNLRPDPATEMTAMQVVMDYEAARGRQVYDVHEQNLGYDVTSLDLKSGELRLIEVKGLAAASGDILLTPNERRVAEDLRDCYWLYVVTNCASAPQLQEPVADPAQFPWHEESKVQRSLPPECERYDRADGDTGRTGRLRSLKTDHPQRMQTPGRGGLPHR